MATWQDLYPSLAKAYAANPSDPAFSNLSQWASGGADFSNPDIASWMQANDTARSSASAPTWMGNVNTWLNSGGSGTNSAPWQDPNRPNEMTQFNQLYGAYTNDVNNWNTAHPTSAVTATDRNAALGMPVSYNPGLVGKGGGFFGGGMGDILKYAALAAGAYYGGGALLGGLGEAGTIAGDAYLPGALGADGLGAGAAVTSGVAGDAYLPGILPSGAGDAYLPGALGGSDAGGSLLNGAGSVPGDAYMPGALNSTMTPSQFAAGGSGASLGLPNGTGTVLDSLKKYLNPSTGSTGASLIPGISNASLGSLFSGALGAFGANSQANALQGVADRNRAERAPFLNLATKYAYDPAAYAAGPGQAAMKATLNGLSVQGNPIGSGTALQFATDSANKNWLNGVNTLGSLGLGGQGIQANLDTGAATANSNIFNAVGSAANNIFDPKPSLAQTLAQYQQLVKQ